MKIGLITDTHYGFKKANKSFHDYFVKFYNDVFFTQLKKNKIKTVIHLGDAFDSRKGIDYWALEWAKTNVYDKFKDLGITVYNIVGNHDAYYKNTNQINAVGSLLNEYSNVIKISSPSEFTIGGLDIVCLPWICTDNEKETLELLNKTNSKVVFGHLELNGFMAHPGHVNKDGMSKEIFNKFDRVFSGHYHTRSDDGKVFYLGNPYQMFWSDVNDSRGFHYFDTDTYDLEFIKNPYSMFEKIYYDGDIPNMDYSSVSNKMIKVVVRKNEDQLKFDNFIDLLVQQNPSELKIIENYEVEDSSVDYSDVEIEDTLTILNKYVEESEFDLNKDMIKKILRDTYKEALEIV
jgi:DNA repair exonuclease SbcCD nuclease subunit